MLKDEILPRNFVRYEYLVEGKMGRKLKMLLIFFAKSIN